MDSESVSSGNDSSDIEIVEVQQPEQESEKQSSEASEKARSVELSESAGIKSLRCPICLETPEIVAVASCGHPYCHECIFTALSSARRANRREGECSLCRKRVRYDQVIYMELKKGNNSSTEIDPGSSGKESKEEASIEDRRRASTETSAI